MAKEDLRGKRVTLAHGNGGRLSHEIYSDLICRHFNNEYLNRLSDSAILEHPRSGITFSTDSYVVKPLFFPGGDIGKLAVCGTVNDLSVMGARPCFLSCGLIIEDGFGLEDLDRVLASMAKTAKTCNVSIVTGDTKVVEHGSCDGLFINTSGIGFFDNGDPGFSPDTMKPSDRVIITGTIGDHGMAILTSRESFPVRSDCTSDCAPIHTLLASVMESVPQSSIRVMRDPTRGGLATTLNEFVQKSGLGIKVDETSIPIRDEVRALCEMAGYDPLYIANEGKAIIVIDAEHADTAVSVLRKHELGKDSAIIGIVSKENAGSVVLKTVIGGERFIDMLTGDMFPRIC